MDGMHNVLILGTGRSGTSMAASLFRHTGAYSGDHPLPANAGNPSGYFEDVLVNLTNDQIIEQCLRWPMLEWKLRRRFSPPAHVDRRAFWLACPTLARRDRVMPDSLRGQMMHLISRRPFCFKDPRFSVTLPHWLIMLPMDTRFLVVFRQPQRTVASMLQLAKTHYCPPLPVNEAWCRRLWVQTYRYLLDASEKVRSPEDWMFVHFDDVLSGAAVPGLEQFVNAPLDATLLDPAQPRQPRPERQSIEMVGPPIPADVVYDRLLARARRDRERFAKSHIAEGVELVQAA